MSRAIRTMVRKDDILNVTRAGGVVAAVAAVGLATAACGSDDSSTSEATTTTGAGTGSAGASTDAGSQGSGAYKNGTYSATGHYNSPGGEQQIGVTVTLDDSTITSVDLDRSQTRGTSSEYQAKFASGISAEVVGKNIDDLDVSKVSGSSLTSGGFNDAIAQIKSEAKS